MDKKTAEALEKSIKHWEENVAAEKPSGVRTGAYACALCSMFNREDGPDDMECVGCPVSERTGHKLCDASPYGWAVDAFLDWKYNSCTRDEWRKAATAELDFLKSLRSNPDEA